MNQQVDFFQILLIHDTYQFTYIFKGKVYFWNFSSPFLSFYDIFNSFIHKFIELFKKITFSLPCKIHTSFEKFMFYTEILTPKVEL